jgi:AcrR family transcriptional regulator
MEAHRRQVHDAILRVTIGLMARHGLHSLTMSQIAEESGIGRATLYKYFPDVEAILIAWHDSLVAGMLERLAQVRDHAGSGRDRVRDVLDAYALMLRERPHGAEFAALMHRQEGLAEAHRKLSAFMQDLLADAASAGAVRSDISPHELANYCRHALGAAHNLPSRAAVGRLVTAVVAGLSPPTGGQTPRIGDRGTETKTGSAWPDARPAGGAAEAR